MLFISKSCRLFHKIGQAKISKSSGDIHRGGWSKQSTTYIARNRVHLERLNPIVTMIVIHNDAL